MGKISDALDKIGTLQESEKLGSPHVQKQAEEIIGSEFSSDIAPEKVTDPVEINGKWDERIFKAVNNDSIMPEIFKTLRSQILTPVDGRKVPKSIMVASSVPREGRSFITANLGVSFANGMDHHCLLVDCDFRHPTLAKSFGLNKKYGLVDYLRDQRDLQGLALETSVPKLSVLPSGSVPDNPAELLSSTRIHAFIQAISKSYVESTIIFDSPPLLTTSESIVLAGQVDAIIMVVRQGRAKKTEVGRCLDLVDREKVIGIVFNDLNPIN